MERVKIALAHRAPGGHDRLGQHEPSKETLAALSRSPAEEVGADPLEVETADETGQWI